MKTDVIEISPTGEGMAEALRQIYPLPDRVTTRPTTSLGEVSQSRAPAVLVELGFITNAHDITILMDDPDTANDETAPLLDAMAQGIHKAIKLLKRS
mgnify:CR=1 FL=1